MFLLLLFGRVGVFFFFCCLGGGACLFFLLFGRGSCFFCCLGSGRVLFFCCLGGGRVFFFGCLGGGRVLVFAVWAGCVFFLLFGRGTGVHSLTGLPGSSLKEPTKKTKQQKKNGFLPLSLAAYRHGYGYKAQIRKGVGNNTYAS